MFVILVGLTLFFAFGPNNTTFLVPIELFPARIRSMCHRISVVAGKLGVILGAFVVQNYIDIAHDKTKGVKQAIMALSFLNLLGSFALSWCLKRKVDRSKKSWKSKKNSKKIMMHVRQ